MGLVADWIGYHFCDIQRGVEWVVGHHDGIGGRRIIRFRRYHQAEAVYLQAAPEHANYAHRAERFFPWLGMGLGLVGLVGMVTLVVAAIAWSAFSLPLNDRVFDVIGFLESMLLSTGAMGVAFSLAALLGRFKLKGLSIVGLAAGVILQVLNFLAMLFL